MLLRIRIWQIPLLQLLVAAGSVVLFGLFVGFPDISRRPEPVVAGVFFLVLACIALAAIFLLTGAAVNRARPLAAVFVALWSIAICLAACYCFVFVWINTFGT
jgi:hypothetical protein